MLPTLSVQSLTTTHAEGELKTRNHFAHESWVDEKWKYVKVPGTLESGKLMLITSARFRFQGQVKHKEDVYASARS